MKYLVVLGIGLAALGLLHPAIALQVIVIMAVVAAVLVLLGVFGVAGFRRIPFLRWLHYKTIVKSDPFGVLAATGDELERRLADLKDHFDRQERERLGIVDRVPAGRR